MRAIQLAAGLLALHARLHTSLLLGLFANRGELLGLLARLLLGLRLQTLLLRPRLGALLLPLLHAGSAQAADRLEVFLEVVGAVVVVDLLARRDVLDGADIDLALDRVNVGFGVGPAG